jgi:peptidoglycan/xylan/chitin deacetylase (PgdA/CDA1 family)
VLPNFVYKYPDLNVKLSTHLCIGAAKAGRTLIFTFMALFFLVFLPMQVSATAHQVTQWADNKAGAVSITFDDGLDSQYNLAVPALNDKGFKGSFFIITGTVTDNPISGYASWEQWRNAASQGHEIGSHTKTHPHLPELSLTEMEEEIGESKAIIDDQITTQECLTFVYPFGDYDSKAKAFANAYYIAARGVWCGFNKTPYDFYGLRGCGDSDSLEQMKSNTDEAEQQGYWLITIHHSLDGTGYGFWTIDTFITYLDYLQTKNLWVGTFGSVVKYIKEREAANLSLVSSSDNQIVLSLTDTLDDAIFDQPLTIRSEVPSSWTQVMVQQGTGAITVRPVVEGTQTVVYYNVVPDGGLITLQKLTKYQLTVTGLSSSSATVGGPSFTLTVYGIYFVNGSTVRWNSSSRPTTFVSRNQLTATITASDISAAGMASITVYNPSGGISNEMIFEIRNLMLALTIQKSGSGTGIVSATGISCGSDCTEIYNSGTAVVLTASQGADSSFSGWSGCNSVNGNTCTINMTAKKSITASFTLNQHTLTVEKTGTGSGTITGTGISCDADCRETYPYGTAITLTAAASSGSTFSAWNGCDTVSSNICAITITGSKSVSATFVLSRPNLTVRQTGTGSGTLTASGLSCTDNICTGTYNYNDTVHISLAADIRSTFEGWTGCDSTTDNVCTILINGDRDVTATLHLEYSLVVALEGSGKGKIASLPSGIDCEESSCSNTFVVGTPVQLTTWPYDGSVFAFWSGGCTGTTETCDLTMTDDTKVAAHLVPYGTKKYNLKVKKAKKNKGDGTVTSTDRNITCGDTCSYKYYKDSVITLSAEANEGSTFIGWKSEFATCISTDPCTITIDKAKTVQAVFVGDYTLKVTCQNKKGGTGLVSSTPSGISCSTISSTGCAATYPYTEYVALSASPDAGSTFLGWSPANLCPGTGDCSVQMDKKRNITAVFLGQ